MLARKVEYIHYVNHRSVAIGKAEHAEQRFGVFIGKTLFLLFLIFVFLLSCITLISMKNNYSYTLNQKKQQVRQLQQDNDALRVRIAALETPERIYTIATKELGMVVPSQLLYSQSRTNVVRKMNP